MLRLREELLAVEEDCLAGHAGVTPDELNNIINEAEHGKKCQYKVIISDRARQILAGYVRFLAQKVPLLPAEERMN